MAKKGKAILLVYTDLVDEKYDEEFNAWYDTQHLPQLTALPGVLDAARYVAVKGGPKYLAVYEVESLDTVLGPAWANRPIPPWDNRMSPRVIGKNFTRVLGEQIFPAQVEQTERSLPPALQIGRMSVPDEIDAAWNAWYNEEYIPAYLTVPGVISARRFRVKDGNVRYTTVYEFESTEVPETAAWDQQRQHSSPKNVEMRDVMDMAYGSPGVYRRM
ncbi:MAG: DUF4286 family protein [Chloroflexota bacterium]